MPFVLLSSIFKACSNTSILSMPIAKPKHEHSLPPSSETSFAYLPPPTKVGCPLRVGLVVLISNTTFV